MATLELLFIPSLWIGHLVLTIEFAKRLISRNERLSVTVLCMKFQLSPHADECTKALVGPQTRIKLINLPHVDLPPPDILILPEYYVYDCVESVIHHVRNTIRDVVSSSEVVGLVLDFFCMPMMDVANEFGRPSYNFLTFNLGFLDLVLYLPSRRDKISSEFKDSDPESMPLGFVNPVSESVLPSALFCKDGGYTTYIKLARRFRETKGMVVNSFVELKHYWFSVNQQYSHVKAVPKLP